MVAAVNPPVRNPTLALMGRTIPAAWGPDVVVAFPVVITGDPYITAIGGPAAFFMDAWRRPDANHNLRKRSRRGESESEQQCQCNFFHDESNLLSLSCRNHDRLPAC
jgi:hypothetical protein